MSEQARQLQLLLDEQEIRDLAVRYASAVDRADGEALAALFTEDGVMTGGTGDMHGRKAIATGPSSSVASLHLAYHMVHNHHVALDGDRATGEVYSQAHLLTKSADGGMGDRWVAITYHDRYVRQDGAWLFERRDLDRRWMHTLQPDAAGKS